MKLTAVAAKQSIKLAYKKWSIKLGSDEHKRSVRNCYCENNEIAKNC